MDNILFVTAYKDIKRVGWSAYGRSNAEYIGMFLNLARRIQYSLIVFCEPSIKDELILYNLPSNIILKNWNEVDTFYHRFLHTENEIINSQEYKAKVAPHRQVNPEHLYAEYNLVNHSKINFVRKAKEMYPNYKFYSWLDFGFCRNVADCPMNLLIKTIPEKITYLALRSGKRVSPVELLRSDDIYLSGSMFIVFTDYVETFEKAYEEKLKEYHRLGVSDDDQSVVTQMYWDRPDWFNVIVDNEWFSLFRKYYNGPKTKNEFHILLNRLSLNGKYVEIGVARGNFSEYLCRSLPFEKLYLVDPYKTFSLDEYTDAMNAYDMEQEFNYTVNRLARFAEKIEFIRKMSMDALDHFEDESLDFVYIDGNHAYKNVLEDLEGYWKKVRKGGILAGDDCYDTTGEAIIFWDNVKDIHQSRSFGKFGVLQALQDFCTRKGLEYVRFDNQFYILKA